MIRFRLPALLLTLPLLVSACGAEPDTRLHGYAEGDFIRIAPQQPGLVIDTAAREGGRIARGDELLRQDATAEIAALAAATARIDAATARYDDALAGARDPEIEAARDLLRQALAARNDATQSLERSQALFADGHVSQARLDAVRAAATAADARVDEMRQRLNIVRLPARADQLRALQAEIAAAEAERDAATYRLDLRTVRAPVDARIHRQLRFVGEQAGPGTPVYELLPDGAVHAVLFIPEPLLAGLPVGTRLDVSCDACPSGLRAAITTIDDEAEFTPPILYSDAERARLVYRAEARFSGDTPPPGTPLFLEPAQ
ncbi:HlyD family efflux transporter periplasmic adaptor subunit [Maricaulis sp.]|uniref:HlyD family secretion protein n=1 Tax=Maricaulis sp. TaxID=1486257 RepID=UPI0025BDF81F|nr:HlyD family efflux transporter periplasmic adaptor subunit [Maricaulis sp.]